MKLTLNGEPYTHGGDGTVAAVLTELGADGNRVAVMINGNVVTRSARAQTAIHEGDTLEVVTFAGGG